MNPGIMKEIIFENSGRNCEHDYIAFLDADDAWFPDFLSEEKMLQWCELQYDIISYKDVIANAF